MVELIEETVSQAIIDGDALIAEAGLMSFNDDLQMWQEHGVDLTKDNTLDQLNKAFIKQTMGELENLTRSTGALDVGGVPILNAYRHEMDLATIKVASGAFSFQQAMEDCCHRLGKNGVAVTYPSGRKYSLESATRMCMKTGLSQLSGKITEANMDKTSTSLVYVSAHSGARPEHAEWQGKVYTYKGKPSKKYPDFVESTGYGTVTGLKGVNCSHEFYPWWEGDEIPEFHEPDPVEIDGRTYTYYEATQKQRQMERSVRNMNREQQAALAAGDNQKATELNAKIKATKQDYKAFSQAAGLRAKTERMRTFDGPTKTVGLSAGNGSDVVKPHPKPKALGSIDYKDEKAVNKVFEDFRKEVVSLEDEQACVILNTGQIFRCYGVGDEVWPDYDLGELIRGAKVTHNHPEKYTEFTFEAADFDLFNKYELAELEGFDYKYIYKLSRIDKTVEEIQFEDISEITEEDGQHLFTIIKAQMYGVGCRRRRND